MIWDDQDLVALDQVFGDVAVLSVTRPTEYGDISIYPR
jgi:hypothetical protein